jgi:hypothetical protein
MGMIDRQYKNTLQVCIEQKQELFEELLECKDRIRMLEKLIELNMKDLHDIADQRDWYYEEYRKLKDKNILDIAKKS